MMAFETKMNALLSENNRQSDRPVKRLRLQNFTERENELLVNLAHQEAAILENKKTDTASNTLKTEVWHAITEVFNSHRISDLRDMVSLRNRYENLKRRLRRKILDQKEVLAEGESVQMMATNYEAKLWEMMGSKPEGVEILNDAVIEVIGSGSSRKIQFIPAEDLDEEQAEILGINYERSDPRVASVSPLTIKGEASRDSTRETSDDEVVEVGVRPSTVRASTTDTTTTTNANTKNVVVNPSEVRQYLSSAGRLLDETINRRYRSVKPKPANVTSESSDGNRFREEEHQLKMKIMKEEHEAKMKLLAQELKTNEEEHALRMKILKRKLIVICEDI